MHNNTSNCTFGHIIHFSIGDYDECNAGSAKEEVEAEK